MSLEGEGVRRSRGLPALIALGAAAALLAAACSGGADDALGAGERAPTEQPAATATAAPAVQATAPPEATASAAAISFPTGPAVIVAADYVIPDDRVDSTGAYLPANGKPTVVFVDAIW